LERKDIEEATEHLFKAKRFYSRAIPYSANSDLLKGIFYYDYLATYASGKKKKAAEKYCAYVDIVRALAGNVGPLEQFDPLAASCGGTAVSGTVELTITSDVDGAHVYIDNRAVGVVGRKVPFVNPFIPAGPHFIEVRKAGRVRWGSLANLKKGKPIKLRARLKRARPDVNRAEYDPLANLRFRGKKAYSDEYLAEVLFRVGELYGVKEMCLGYLEPVRGGRLRLTILEFNGEAVSQKKLSVPATIDGYRSALSKYWKARFGRNLDPGDIQSAQRGFSPTLFKVNE